jgi:hypothetical protein
MIERSPVAVKTGSVKEIQLNDFKNWSVRVIGGVG